jgi:fermentation-respiration switch protein FrsA (DUF1100 family)
MDRTELTFTSGGERCAAWLYTPDGPEPHACVVLGHGFGGTREARLWAYAERFAQAGLAALVFDYRYFGASGGEPRQLLDIRGQLADWRAAIAFARSLEAVDPQRIVAWGTSFSGGHVAVIAGEDQRLVAAISQCPFLDGLPTLRVAGPRNSLRLTAAGLRDEARRITGRSPYTMPIVGPPGTLAAMTQPDAEPGYRALFEPGAEFRNEVAARIALRIGTYRPIARTREIACPWLIAVCDRDTVTPTEPALRAAARAGRAEVRHYDCGHFDIYVGEWFERTVADQVDFLRRHAIAGGEDRAQAAST